MSRRFFNAFLKSIIILCCNYFLFAVLTAALFYKGASEFEKSRWLYGFLSLLHLVLQGIWLRFKKYPVKDIFVILSAVAIIYLLAFP